MKIPDLYRKRKIHRFFETGEVQELEDDVINECRIHIRLDGEDFIQTVISPSLIREFILGFLLTRKIIEGLPDVSSLDISANTVSVTRISRLRWTLPQLRLLESSGVRTVTREVIFSAEDIGRHNSVDKVIGGGLTKGVHFGRSWLAVSGRLPADMVFKSLVAGIPLIASVSAPTSDGIEMGERGGVTVVGFTRGGRLNCYCHPERIT